MNDTLQAGVPPLDIPDKMFEKLPAARKEAEETVRPSESFVTFALRKYLSNPFAVAGMIVLVLFAVLSLVGPLVSPYTYDGQNIMHQNQFPSLRHIFGTDKFGRDEFVRVLYGLRISLTIGFVTALINCVLGVLIGGIAGYFGGVADMIIMRIIDVLTSVPSMLYMILIMVVMGNSVRSILLALCITYWIGTARIVRSQVLTLKSQEYVLAARVLGASNSRILFRHLIPNSLGPILITVSYIIPSAIFSEAFLSFLGIGIQAPMASLGTLVNDAIPQMFGWPYQMLFPVMAIVITMFALNFICDGLRDAFDTRLGQ